MPLRRRHIETPDPWIIQIRDVNLVVPVPPKGDQRVAANDSWNLGDPEGVKIVLSCLVYFPGLKSRDQAMNIWSLWSSTWNIDEYWFLNQSGNSPKKTGSDCQDSHLARCFVPAEKWPTLQRGVHESLHLILPEASTIRLSICGFYFSNLASNRS